MDFGYITEAQLQTAVLDAMGWMGWTTYHTHDSRRSNPGFPDVVAFKDSRLIFVEFKREKEEPTENQVLWLDGLVCAHDEVYLVRPSTQDAFMENVVLLGSNLSTHWRNQRE